MINYKLILKILGLLLLGEAVLMVVPLLVTILSTDAHNDNEDILGFIFGILITLIAGFLCRYYGQPENEAMKKKEAYLLVSLTWIIFSIFGSLPFIMSGMVSSYTDAYFETMSGFTTTGSSIIDNIDVYPAGLLLWRSMTQWIGGLGIAFFTIAILPGLVLGGSVKVFSAEATGPLRTKMHPKLSTNAQMIVSVYTALSVACVVCFYLGGMPLFDAVNYAMSTTATGGFATHGSSTSYYKSAFIDYSTILFMFLSGMNFTMLYLGAIKGQVKNMWKDSEFRFYLYMVGIATAIITLCLIFGKTNYDFLTAFRNALFQVVSFVTTTGSFNDNTSNWPRFTWFVLVILMFIGACAGSTSGGLKCIRAVMIMKVVRNELKKLLHPKAVLPLKINGNSVSSQQQVTLLAFIVVYLLLCVATYAVLMIFDAEWINTVDAITIAISSASNVGPALGNPIGNTSSWSQLSDISKWLCSFLMLMGRLEILGVLVIFTPAFWRER